MEREGGDGGGADPRPPQDDIVYLKVNKLSSVKTQLPYEYYSLPYCRPDPITNSAENLGEVLKGDRIKNSLYQIEMRLDEQCKVLCKLDSLTERQAKGFQDRIKNEYRVNMCVVGRPSPPPPSPSPARTAAPRRRRACPRADGRPPGSPWLPPRPLPGRTGSWTTCPWPW